MYFVYMEYGMIQYYNYKCVIEGELEINLYFFGQL